MTDSSPPWTPCTPPVHLLGLPPLHSLCYEMISQLEFSNRFMCLCNNSIYNDLESIIQNIKDIDEPKIILFSPGSQSYDHYNNFEERGEHFNRLINKYWHN